VPTIQHSAKGVRVPSKHGIRGAVNTFKEKGSPGNPDICRESKKELVGVIKVPFGSRGLELKFNPVTSKRIRESCYLEILNKICLQNFCADEC
jgi:hypothetical protein